MLAINSGSALAGKNRPSLAVLGDQLVGPLVIAVEDRDAEPLLRRVSRQVCAHDGQSHNANVSLISHDFSAHFPGQVACLSPASEGRANPQVKSSRALASATRRARRRRHDG